MPKSTFFNLPEKKRQTLVKAAEKEFSRVPLSEASIANIVKVAGISRGSFYQYFEDKEDAFFFIFNEETKERKSLFVSVLKKHNGDIVDAMTEIYQVFLEQLPDEEELDFFKNALLNVTHKIENAFIDMFDGHESNEHIQLITQLINKDCLNIKNDKELFHIMQIITAVAFRNFVEKFTKELTDKEAIDNFTIEMNLLKSGLYK